MRPRVESETMRAYVRIAAPDGTLHELVHGDVVGRLRSASLAVDDGRVSEAHAMVSLREQELRLLSLRGRFAVGGTNLKEVVLSPGLRIQLVQNLFLRVDTVVLPDVVMGLEAPGIPRQVLPPVCSLVRDPEYRLVAGWVEGAPLHAWSTGSGWSIRVEDSSPRPLQFDDVVKIGNLDIQMVAIPLAAAGEAPTHTRGAVDAPLKVVASYDVVHIHRDGVVAATIAGMQAQLVSELATLACPVGWEPLARELWRDGSDSAVLRPRLDVTLGRLRRRLQRAGLRSDLVRMDGAGNIELFLYPGDEVDDRT